ncbi:MAG: hypothetical protein A2Z40_03260 [Deltaproteobacteria bacterium RBG_19FT_COMBO_60_16]|nr:MAG: hypothetical protein A2Z40_03260 [Deltaproteobacteria bacterium RBG_19FT_COMBO_60_16]
MKNLLVILLVIVFPAGVIAAMDNEATVDSLLQGLKNKSYRTAWSSVEKLAEFPLEKERIVPVLIEALGYEWEECTGDIRQGIAYTLAALKAKDGVFPMLALLKKGGDTSHSCAECGCCFNALSVGDVFEERNLDPFCENGVLKAIDQLADFSHSKAIADLITEGKHRTELLITLGKVGPPRYAHFISRFRNDNSAEVRRGVAVALGLIDNEEVSVPVLTGYMSKTGEVFLVRWDASDSLINIGSKRANPGLRVRMADLLKSQDDTTAALAGRVLSRLGDERGLLRLRELASRGDWESILYLGEAQDAGARELLVGKLKEENLAVRAVAIFSLGRIGDASTVPLLKEAFEDSIHVTKSMEEKRKQGVSEQDLAARYGYSRGGRDVLQATLYEAIDSIEKRTGPLPPATRNPGSQ